MKKQRFWPSLKVDKNTPVPLHFQIACAISQEVQRQYSVQRGMRLPSEYQLAKHLSVSRGTIHKAYQHLLKDKIAVLKPSRRGLFVSPVMPGKIGASSFPTLGLVLPLAFKTYIDQGQFDTLDYLSGILDTASELGFSTTFITLPPPAENTARLQKWLDQMRSKLSGLMYLGGPVT